MNMIEIVRRWLLEHDYDGLYNDWGGGCECGVNGLAPCGDPDPFRCAAAVKGQDGMFYPADVSGEEP